MLLTDTEPLTSGEEWVPHEYQKKVMKLFLQQAAGGALLDPGLGKTSISLAVVSTLQRMKITKRWLVITPLRPAYLVWPREIQKWSNFGHLKYHILHGSGRNPWQIPEGTDIVIVNPEGLLWLMSEDFTDRFEALGVDALLVDESTRFADSTTKRFKLLKSRLHKLKRRYILTGSVVPNGLLGLFGQMYVLDRGNALGPNITAFKKEYFYTDPYEPHKWIPHKHAFDEIVEKVSPLTLQMQAEDYLEMPELIHHTIEVTLPHDVQVLYDEVENDFLTLLADGTPIVAANAAVAGGKCRQIANGAIYYNVPHPSGEINAETGEPKLLRKTRVLHHEKLDALVELLEELQGNPVLIGYEFQHDRDAILKKYPDMPVISGMSMKNVTTLMDGFNRGEVPQILGHPASMGHGLNLQGKCHHVIWYGITWNFEHYDQMIRRVYRQGQENEHVFVYHIVAQGTKDADVAPVLEQKEKTQRDLLNALVPPQLKDIIV